MSIPIKDLDKYGNNCERIQVSKPSEVPGCAEGQAVRFGYNFRSDTDVSLESLLYNKGSKTLVVSLHGALNRKTFRLPRFERLSSLAGVEASALFISDPSLFIDDTLELGWFTGWEGYNLFPVLAELIKRAADEVGASQIVISGSSGGGFASLQIASLIDHSVALAFNPQTDIHRYWQGGDPTKHGAVRKYIEVLYPSAAPDGIWKIDWDVDWSVQYGTLHSAVRRFREPVNCSVVYLNNKNDFHVKQHFEPFAQALEESGQLDALTAIAYEGDAGHFPPSPKVFAEGLDYAFKVLAN